MDRTELERRDFLKSLLATLSIGAVDWAALAADAGAAPRDDGYDAIVIGSGLGGLSCAAAFARQGFRPLVLEQHTKPGGYATTFKRGDFVFDVSLHSTAVGERDGVHNLIPGFPEIADVEFVPHPYLYRAIFPQHDIRVPQRDPHAYAALLAGHFPEEKEGIEALLADMRGLTAEVQKLSQARGQIDMSRFPVEFPLLVKSSSMTWGQMVDARLRDPRLKAIVSALWGYYGLPPSRLSPFYYALPTWSYLEEGGCYPVGRSQKISDAFVEFITAHGGQVRLETRVREILVEDHAACGVRTQTGEEFRARVVVSNASAPDTFRKLLPAAEVPADYLGKLDGYGISLSSFQVYLGLKKDLVGELGIKDSEVFYQTGYDPEADFREALAGNVGAGGFGAMLYDNVYPGYSPKGKNTLNLLTLTGYEPWRKYEADYLAGNKTAYKAEKERLADVLIELAEKVLLPGLRKAIEVREVGTPLTNLRYTANPRGAIYGWDQTLDNSGSTRLPHKTPVKNLYLAGAWTRPGHGYGGVLWSGLECFGEIAGEWKKG
jgi:all-trans-retinol 13,14-reductase